MRVGKRLIAGIFALTFGMFWLIADRADAQHAVMLPANFPRLGMWFPKTDTEPITKTARYDFLVLAQDQESALPALKAANPNQIELMYQDVSEESYDPAGDASVNAEVLALPYQWFLTQVGSTLTAPVDTMQTQIPVANLVNADGSATFVVSDTALIENETVFVTSVDGASKTLTVQRGYVRPGSAHAAGTRIAAHIAFWPQSWMMNASTLAPRVVVSPSIGAENWAEYRARQGIQLVSPAAWDGILVDRGDGTQSWLVGNSTARTIDPDNSNTLPSDQYAAFDQAWGAGIRNYHTRLRAGLGSKIVYVNWGMPNYDLLNGNNIEGFPLDNGNSYQGDWRATMFGALSEGSYFDWMTNAQSPNLTMVETYEDDGGPDPTGNGSYNNRCVQAGFTPNYRKMRFGLTTALLNDGFFSYEMNTNGHGSLCLLWFDEYDNAGAGRGYLGTPLGAAKPVMGGQDVWRRDFSNGIALVNATAVTQTISLGGTFQKIRGTQAPAINDGSFVAQITLAPRDGIILLRPTTLRTLFLPLVRR
ncbi:MAG: hypothetical protein KGJ80_13735 [Chloroflexota bacterium]|nr:hypothetical protein [Chloroflexota bacterium]